MPNESWITAPFNHLFAAPANWVLNAVGTPAADPAHPWAVWMATEIVIVLLMAVFFAVLKTRLSVEKPGKAQHIFELIYEFLRAQAEEVVGHGSRRFLAFFGTVFLFILFMNLAGAIPTVEAPTMFAAVPLGCAVAVFLHYHSAGLKEHGLFGYLKQFMGPMLWLAPMMVPIELFSHFSRPLSLTVRLFANMFAGERVTDTFVGLTYIGIPVLAMALHIFVSFLQAYIFALLSMIYVSGAVAHEH